MPLILCDWRLHRQDALVSTNDAHTIVEWSFPPSAHPSHTPMVVAIFFGSHFQTQFQMATKTRWSRMLEGRDNIWSVNKEVYYFHQTIQTLSLFSNKGFIVRIQRIVVYIESEVLEVFLTLAFHVFTSGATQAGANATQVNNHSLPARLPRPAFIFPSELPPPFLRFTRPRVCVSVSRAEREGTSVAQAGQIRATRPLYTSACVFSCVWCSTREQIRGRQQRQREREQIERCSATAGAAAAPAPRAKSACCAPK